MNEREAQDQLDIELPVHEASPGRGRSPRRRMPRTTRDNERKIIASGERDAKVVGRDGEVVTQADPVEQQTIRDGERMPL